ncbi:MAG: SRPBCC domain-containing protein [Bacteroidota bacterium]
MIKVNYSIEINAPVAKVYTTMLDKPTYEIWTSEFDPTSSYEGSWEKGSRIIFGAVDKDGATQGMIAEIAENIPNKFVSICHKGMLEGGVEILDGPKVEGWKNATENYTFEPTEMGTKLSVSLDITQEYKDYFDTTWVKALQKLKEICEE